MKSDVYFVQLDSLSPEKRLQALKKILAKVNPFSVYQKEEIVPVKLTIGDSPCVYNVAPELVKWVVGEIKRKGAKPFLFDTSVIYRGQRQNAVDHLNLAQSKGFGHSRVGAPFVIADGVFGKDGTELEINSTWIKRIKTPSFVGMLDSLVVLSHLTGHIVSGYAGAIKNVAMGMSCRSTKQVQHSSLKPSVVTKNCTACGCCIAICPVKAISFEEKKAFIDQKVCLGCGECICACKFDAININWHEDAQIFSQRMVDVAGGILSKFKNKLFINFAFDITKECDCISNKDEKMVAQNLGILISSDPLSIDKASSDLALLHKKTNFFKDVSGVYEEMYEYAAQRGLGNIEYNLIKV
ncbi:MAG: DUF362 domain-containing protein [Candidatus Omnitrophota bacterium]